jgi:hypothetical protein
MKADLNREKPTELHHFHAQVAEKVRYACPGRGDRDMVDRQQIHGLVFTFVDANHLNVDYYQPRGVAIDLGTIARPRVVH